MTDFDILTEGAAVLFIISMVIIGFWIAGKG